MLVISCQLKLNVKFYISVHSSDKLNFESPILFQFIFIRFDSTSTLLHTLDTDYSFKHLKDTDST